MPDDAYLMVKLSKPWRHEDGQKWQAQWWETLNRIIKESIQRRVCPVRKKDLKLYYWKFLNNQTTNQRSLKRGIRFEKKQLT